MTLGISVNAFDVLIAGIAEANGAETIITRDKEFESIAKVTELDIKLLKKSKEPHPCPPFLSGFATAPRTPTASPPSCRW